MTQNRKICPICKRRWVKNPRNKTCGDYECRGKHAEYRRKKRIQRQKAAEPFIRNCMRIAKRDKQDKKICVVCGDFLKASLTTHHFNRRKDPTDVVTLCASCHRIFDSSDAGLRELKTRRKRYYEYNSMSMR